MGGFRTLCRTVHFRLTPSTSGQPWNRERAKRTSTVVNTLHSKPFEALNGAICYGLLLCDERHSSRKKTATPDEMANPAAFMSGSNTNTILRPSCCPSQR